MTNRREFLHATALAAVPAIVVRTGAAAQGPSRAERAAVHAILIDERYAPARAVRACIETGSVTVHSLPDGDVTETWLHQLRPLWEHAPASVGGVTAPATLFCLEQLAWEYGLRVVFHGEHVIMSSGDSEHRILRDTGRHLSSRRLMRAGARWPALIATAMTTPRATPRVRLGPSGAGLEPPVYAGAQRVTSWIIAAT